MWEALGKENDKKRIEEIGEAIFTKIMEVLKMW